MISHGGKSYSYLNFDKNTNEWNNEFAALPSAPPGLPSAPVPPGFTNFYDLIKLGNETGIIEIFEGFELKNKTLAYMSQMINCTFTEFHGFMYASVLIELESGAQFFIKDVKVDNI